MYNLPQKLAAEFLGTFALIFICSGSFCADQYLRAANQPGLGLLAIALANGLAYAVTVTAVAHISGGHLNPAVTIGFWVSRRIGTIQALLYWVVQLAGASLGAYVLSIIIPETTWLPVALGTPDLASDLNRIHGMSLEAALSFILVFVFFATVADAGGAFDKVGGFAVGLVVTAAMLVGYPFTGAAMNPARAFGPALVAHHWTNNGVYWVGPLVGGVIGGFIYSAIFLRDQPPAT